MAHADWKRYYCVVYDAPPSYQPVIWRSREQVLDFLESERRACHYEGSRAKPVGIARIRGRKRNPQLQTWLKENSR